MNELELALRILACLLSHYSLGLASWALADYFLPRPTRLGLRLLVLITTQFVLCAILVQALGLAGLLRFPIYLAASLLPGFLAVGLAWKRQPQRSFFRWLGRVFRVWVLAPRFGMGFLALFFFVFLAKTLFALPQGVDALTLHGPMVVQWIQDGAVTLESRWNYPQVWEYQFAANFLLADSDLLAVLPGGLCLLALLLAVRELAARLALRGYPGYLVSLLVVTLPVLWRDTMKGDPALAVALLLGILVVERAARGVRGASWAIQPALFLTFGTKANGFVYVALLVMLYLVLRFVYRGPWPGWRRWVLFSGLLLAVQSSSVLMQVKNLITYGNPIYPVRLEIAGRVLFDGFAPVAGSSILDNGGHLETWKLFLSGGTRIVGPEWPVLLAVLPIVFLWSLVLLWNHWRGQKLRSGELLLVVLVPTTLVLWLLFLATPWTCNLSPGICNFLITGISLRFGIAPICLTYLLLAWVLRRFLPGRLLLGLWTVAVPLLIFIKWDRALLWTDLPSFLMKLLGAWILATVALGLLKRRWRNRAGLFLRGRAASGPLCVLATVMLLFLHAQQVQRNRARVWQPDFADFWKEAHFTMPASERIATNHPMGQVRYLLFGERFQHQLLLVRAGEKVPADIRYFYYVAGSGKLLAKVNELFLGSGWRRVAGPISRRGALYVREFARDGEAAVPFPVP